MSEKVNVVIPTIGESVSEGTIGRWFFKEGDLVKKDQPLFEVDSDKATLEVTAAASGKLKIILPAGKSASVGTLVGTIETGESGFAAEAKPSPAKESKAPLAQTPVTPPKTETAPAPKAEVALAPAKSIRVSEEELNSTFAFSAASAFDAAVSFVSLASAIFMCPLFFSIVSIIIMSPLFYSCSGGQIHYRFFLPFP